MGNNGADIVFPHLGIVIQNLKNHFMIGNFRVAFYGVIIGCGFLLAMLLVERLAKKSGQKAEIYWDFFAYLIIAGVIGARLYYVVFNWSYYADDPMKIFNTREGGLAIYGGVIAAILALVVFCRVRKQNFFLMADNMIPGLLLGQVMGRWGNFLNCECFGGYTDSLFAMRIRKALVSSSAIDAELKSHVILDGGTEYIQVHPAFLYESVWNAASLLFVLWYGKHRKKRNGEILFLYMILYGTGRFLIEGIRTDSLVIPGTALRVSQCVSLTAALAGLILFAVSRRRGPEAAASVSADSEAAALISADSEAASPGSAGPACTAKAPEGQEAAAAEYAGVPKAAASGGPGSVGWADGNIKAE